MYTKETKNKKRIMFYPSANFIKIKRILNFKVLYSTLRGRTKWFVTQKNG